MQMMIWLRQSNFVDYSLKIKLRNVESFVIVEALHVNSGVSKLGVNEVDMAQFFSYLLFFIKWDFEQISWAKHPRAWMIRFNICNAIYQSNQIIKNGF